ncbi:SAM-dependent methyltransferase [Nocardia sp. alder85J]|uniref:SAM-dependent methyltransferase n=1 Tax=Nocardia sp. alder85J TaxID=2862949 RepID=UPI001CD1CB00|nr:SAM-dependent methyltransferase [Nocardia sp. alder85J]MCX4095940.1 SAM-dependent methyltransferase [Nocardia sp. alder85J]
MADKVADTAMGPMVVVAGEQRLPVERRLCTDELAASMLPPPARWLVGPGPVRRLLKAGTERHSPGVWNGIACRKRYLDELVTAALDDGAEALVLLGAGLDTRGVRLAAPRGVPDFELDKLSNLAVKRRRIRLPDTVFAVPVDFAVDDLGAVLAAAGWQSGSRTVFVWEGVTQYLTEAAVRSTLAALAGVAPGCTLGFTFVQRDFLDGTDLYGAPKMRQRFVTRDAIWKFGLAPAAVPELLAEYGWQQTEQVGAAEYRTRYLTPAGRDEPVNDVERCVRAVKL